jgi:ferric-dicitrate binding protein FerR (iron transport regulator)
MNLTDKDVLELSALCDAVVDGTLTEKQQARLSNWLASSEEARRFYVRALSLSASLYTYASEMQVEAPDAVPRSRILRLGPTWGFGLLAAAASLVFALWLFSMRAGHDSASVEAQPEEFEGAREQAFHARG